MLRRLQSLQSRASERAWTDVTQAVRNVGLFLDPTEDLAVTLKVVDRLVKEGHVRGRLPRADSRELYEGARYKVDAEAMEVYRRLNKKVGKTGPSDLWDVLDDPYDNWPRLAAMRL